MKTMHSSKIHMAGGRCGKGHRAGRNPELVETRRAEPGPSAKFTQGDSTKEPHSKEQRAF